VILYHGRRDASANPKAQMTIQEAAEKLGLADVTLRRQAVSGSLQAVKIGRDWLVTPAAVDAYRADHLGRRKPKPKP
jgi:excisionase family DNA binding protein